MLGILIGTASVVAMISSGQLATQAALAQFKNLGTELLAVSIHTKKTPSTDQHQLSLVDLEDVKKVSSDINLVSPYATLFLPIHFHENQLNAEIIGARQSLAAAIDIKMQMGRFISDLDKDESYCVIGSDLNKNFINPIGQQIKLGDFIFTIIGVADHWSENSFFNQDINNAIIIPIQTAVEISKYTTLDNLVLHLTRKASLETIKNSINQYFSVLAPGDKIFIRSAKELIKSMTLQHNIFNILLGFMGSVSLLVGGIGVMNIMLLAVLERKREIGVRLALGAKRNDIQRMFLSEAIVLTVTGGLLGILLGIALTFIVSQWAHWQFSILFWPIFIGFTMSILIGIFFGYYPALQASRLNPIEILRSD